VAIIILYDSDAIEVAASPSDDADAAMDETTCTHTSWEDDEEEIIVVACREGDSGAHAIDPESGVSPSAAMPVDRRRKLLRVVTLILAVTRKRRTLLYPRRGGMRNRQFSM
jgi:hypothetical protein